MKARIFVAAAGMIFLTILFVRELSTQPSFNGATPGCGGGSCHTFSHGILSVKAENLNVTITLTGTTSRVAGELVDETGTVVATNNSSTTNPFTLTAPKAGVYLVDAGFRSPSRQWDSLRVTLGTTTSVADATPVHAAIYQNFPNPFNPVTEIRYEVGARGEQGQEASHVRLSVSDYLGREIATIVNENQEPGVYRASFDARSQGQSLSSGVYFYRLQVGSVNLVRKMVLAK